jgi:hypothetical protein
MSNLNVDTISAYSTAQVSIASGLNFTGSANGTVTTLSISSNTASLNMSTGNFFDLQLVANTTTLLNVTNLNAGETTNIRVKQPLTTGTGSMTFSSNIEQVVGQAYVPSTQTGSVDIVSLVTFDNSTAYLTKLRNFA